MSWEQKLTATLRRPWPARIELVVELAATWRRATEAFAAVPEVSIPTALRAFHDRLGGSLPSVCTQNHILPVDALTAKDGMITFASENQGVYRWAVRETDEDDPSVFGRFEEKDPWMDLNTEVSLFLVQFVALEALLAAPFGAAKGWLEQQSLRTIEREMTLFAAPPWQWPSPPGRMHLRGDALAFSCPNQPPLGKTDDMTDFSFWIGALDAESLGLMAQHVDQSWERAELGAG